jgi:hypothetical protein
MGLLKDLLCHKLCQKETKIAVPDTPRKRKVVCKKKSVKEDSSIDKKTSKTKKTPRKKLVSKKCKHLESDNKYNIAKEKKKRKQSKHTKVDTALVEKPTQEVLSDSNSYKQSLFNK